MAHAKRQKSPAVCRITSMVNSSTYQIWFCGTAMVGPVAKVNPVVPMKVPGPMSALLDEPNNARLTRLLKEMSLETQFIVITHSKKTKESAQSMYGVTMQEPGVSKLVSVRWDEPAAAQSATNAA